MTKAHHFNPEILREYDIRGIAGSTLHPEDARHVGRAFAALAHRKFGHAPLITTARDGRLSSPALHEALVKGLVEAGAQVIDTGIGPTPMLYFAVHHLNADGGIMVTGSHNPPDHNGFKMMMGKESFFGQSIQNLAGLAARGTEEASGGNVKQADVREAYIERLLRDAPNLVCHSPLATRHLRVAWDPGNGAAGDILQRLVRRLSGEHVIINAAIDGTFPAHHPDPSEEENLQELIALVTGENPLPLPGGGREGVESGAILAKSTPPQPSPKRGGSLLPFDLGIAFDGDADRIGVVDARGRVLWGDQLLLFFAEEVAAEVPGAKVIADVKAGRAFFEEARKRGAEPLMWKTGHSHIKSRMKEIGALVAGEMSGHMFFAHKFYGHDDAIYAAIRLLNWLAAEGRPPLERLIDALPPTVATPDLRIPVPGNRKFEVIEEVAARLRKAGIPFNDVDGMRVEKQEGWWLLRASNTGELVTVRAEAGNEQHLAALKEEVREQLRLSGVEMPVDK